MRDRLIDMVKESLVKHIDKTHMLAENIADDLLANGIIVPPCKVGDTVYWAFYDKGEEIAEVFEGFVRGLSIGQNGTTWFSVVYDNGLTYEHTFKDYWGKTVFLTRDEAEKALAEREGKKG